MTNCKIQANVGAVDREVCDERHVKNNALHLFVA